MMLRNAPALKNGTGFRAEAKEGYYLDYLNLGFHVSPSVGHDNHWRNWGISTDARIGVIANALTRPDILSALKARHTFASDDKNIEVIFRSGESLGGDVVQAPQPGTTLPLSVEIRDPDEPNARYRLDVLSDLPGGDRARRLVTEGLADILAADNHGDGRLLETGHAMLREHGGTEQAELLTVRNPAAILADGLVEDVPPIALRVSVLERLRRLWHQAGEET